MCLLLEVFIYKQHVILNKHTERLQTLEFIRVYLNMPKQWFTSQSVPISLFGETCKMYDMMIMMKDIFIPFSIFHVQEQFK